MDALIAYHDATKHSPASVQASRFALDWPNKPQPFKVYTSLAAVPLPLEFTPSAPAALEAIAGITAATDRALDLPMLARLCYFANGITRVLERQGQKIPFRAAACTGALYHVELYVVCGDLMDPAHPPSDGGSESAPRVTLEAGVYHYAAHDNALRLLRRGDFRAVLSSATGSEPSIGQAPAVLVCTSTFWRNAWKYQARAYRHAFWDTGTIVANLLGVAAANHVSARLVVGFADAPVNDLLDVDPTQEVAICLISLGRGAEVAESAPSRKALHLKTEPLSASQVDYPEIVEAHNASSLASGAAAAAWRAAASARAAPWDALDTDAGDLDRGRPAPSIEHVILRRGSSRRFTYQPISQDQLRDMLVAATRPIPADMDSQAMTEPYLIVNAVDGLSAGTYVFHKEPARLEPLRLGDFRHQAAFLDLGQDLAGQAAVNVYWLANLTAVHKTLGTRGYRAAQLAAAVEGGKLYLAAYALGLGATGLTFFDDEVTRFFSPHAAGKSVLFLTAVGHPARRSA